MKATCKNCAFVSEFVEPDGSIQLRSLTFTSKTVVPWGLRFFIASACNKKYILDKKT